MDFKRLCVNTGLTDNEICEYVGISARSLQRYKKNNDAPVAIIECLRIASGYPPKFCKTFKGWFFDERGLWSPENYCFTSGDVMATFIDKQYISGLEQEIAELKEVKKQARSKSNVIHFPIKRSIENSA
jgi:transcriptional regulator with XRE-family HTH domain